MQLRRSVIKKPGEQFLVCYPTCAFFELFSLSTFRFVPLNMASMMADLYSASSRGLVSSSTVSCVRSSCLSSGLLRLWMKNGLVCQQRDEPHQFIQSHLKVLRPHELLTQIFKTSVSCGDFLGGTGRENEFKLLPANVDFCASVVHKNPPHACANVGSYTSVYQPLITDAETPVLSSDTSAFHGCLP